MYAESISLKNYRNIREMTLDLSPNVNIICGENAQGKTNILESIYMCSQGRSHRSGIPDKDIIAFKEKESHIKLMVCGGIEGTRQDKIDLHLTRGKKKAIAVNGINIQKLGDLFGIINTVFFGPQDLQLIKAGPVERRRFMDTELCQINPIYYYNLKRYYKILNERNDLLKKLRENKGKFKEGMLDIYDDFLAESGIRLQTIRAEFIIKLNKYAKKIHSDISVGRESLELFYKPDLKIEGYREKLASTHERDIVYGSTLHGIHKDDFVFYINDVNARDFGSQGQQRSACLSVKLAEIELIKAEKGENPVLLLDDVLSELDKLRQEALISSMGDIQTILTCTGVEDFVTALSQKSKIFNIKSGKVL